MVTDDTRTLLSVKYVYDDTAAAAAGATDLFYHIPRKFSIRSTAA